jgi:hypothetical protein
VTNRSSEVADANGDVEPGGLTLDGTDGGEDLWTNDDIAGFNVSSLEHTWQALGVSFGVSSALTMLPAIAEVREKALHADRPMCTDRCATS